MLENETKDGTFLFRNGDSILAVSDTGIGISLTGNINDIKKIEPIRKKFRLQNSKNITLTVLTLNGSLEVEED
mgnify:FL=1